MSDDDALHVRSRQLLAECIPQRPHAVGGHVRTRVRAPIHDLDIGNLPDRRRESENVAPRQ